MCWLFWRYMNVWRICNSYLHCQIYRKSHMGQLMSCILCCLWGAFQKRIWALKNSMLHKNRIFQCRGSIFCVEFQRVSFKFQTKYLTHRLRDAYFIQMLKFKSSPPDHISEWGKMLFVQHLFSLVPSLIMWSETTGKVWSLMLNEINTNAQWTLMLNGMNTDAEWNGHQCLMDFWL